MMLRSRRALRIALVVVAGATAVVSCNDGLYPPPAVPGYYRLETVNGRPLPYVSPPSFGFPWRIWRGDLLLRTDGTFMQGVGSNTLLGPTGDGTYSQSGRELVFRWRSTLPDAEPLVATVAGDSISVTYEGATQSENLHFVFRRAAMPPRVIPDSRYRLTWVNGRTGEPLVVQDTTIDGNRFVSVVLFDTLEFRDGIFVRRHRAETDTAYWSGFPPNLASSEWTTWGAVESGSGWARLVYYNGSTPDSVSIQGDTLVRRTLLITGLFEERYTR